MVAWRAILQRGEDQENSRRKLWLARLYCRKIKSPALPRLPKQKTAEGTAWGTGKQARVLSKFRRLLARMSESDRQLLLYMAQKMARRVGFAFKRFWFTDLSPISVDEPARILEKVFFTPKDFQDGGLYSFRD